MENRFRRERNTARSMMETMYSYDLVLSCRIRLMEAKGFLFVGFFNLDVVEAGFGLETVEIFLLVFDFVRDGPEGFEKETGEDRSGLPHRFITG